MPCKPRRVEGRRGRKRRTRTACELSAPSRPPANSLLTAAETAPRCQQRLTGLPCHVSVRRSREDLRAPGLRCSVMACGLLISRAAPPVPRLSESGVPPPYSRHILFSDFCFCTGSGRCSCRAMSLHFPVHRAAGAKSLEPVRNRAGARGEQIPRDWIGPVHRTGVCLCPLRRLCAADACTPAGCGG